MLNATYLYLAVLCGYYTDSDWLKWADDEILYNDKVEDWIHSVALTSNKSEVCKILYEQSLNECYSEQTGVFRTDGDVIVGYYYMMFKDGRISMYELISRLGDEDDLSVDSSIHDKKNFCDLYFKINNNLEILNESDIKMELEILFAPYVELAKQQQNKLEAHIRKK